MKYLPLTASIVVLGLLSWQATVNDWAGEPLLWAYFAALVLLACFSWLPEDKKK